MKIGIDASRLIESGRTGTENYLYFLVRSLAVVDLDNEYVLFFRSEISDVFRDELFLGNKNFSYKVLPTALSWTQVSLAFEVFKSDLDVLFCPWHTITAINSILGHVKIVSVIHDLTGRVLPTYWTVNFSDKVIAVSNYVKEEIISKYSLSSSLVEVVHEGFSDKLERVGLDEIEMVKKKYDIEGDYILFLGTLGPRKNLERMAKAHLAKIPNVTFVLAGKVFDGYDASVLEGVHYIGVVPDEDLSGLYSGARFLSFVSKEEGFGLPILESMSCGTPVLTSNITATKEIAGEAGMLVDPFSVEDIGNGMKKLLENENLAQVLVDKGYVNLERFSWKNSALDSIFIFESLFGGSKE